MMDDAISAPVEPSAASNIAEPPREEPTQTRVMGTIAAPVGSNILPLTPETRGKLQVVISDEGFEAGRLNTVSIVISNPFEVAVEIIDIEAPQSTYLGGRLREQQKRPSSRAANLAEATNKPKNTDVERTPETNVQLRSNKFLDRLFNFLGSAEVSIGVPSFSGASIKFTEPNVPTFMLNANEGADIQLDQPLGDFTNIRINLDKNAKLKLTDQTAKRLATGFDHDSEDTDSLARHIIEPHCEVVVYVPMITKGWMFFKPLRMSLTYLIRFRTVSNPRRVLTQVVTSALDVRPPLRSVVIGSIFGSILGASAKFAQQVAQAGNDGVTILIGHASVEITQVVGAAMMAVIATVALSRKSGAQSFITVEDFL